MYNFKINGIMINVNERVCCGCRAYFANAVLFMYIIHVIKSQKCSNIGIPRKESKIESKRYLKMNSILSRMKRLAEL